MPFTWLAALAVPAAPAPAPWIAFDAGGGALRVGVAVAGRPLVAVIDTGTTYSVIDTAAAARLKLRPTRTRTIQAVGGPAVLGVVEAVRIRLPGGAVHHIAIGLGDLGPLARALGRPFDVVLGMDVLGGSALAIDFAARRLRLDTGPPDLPGARSAPLLPARRGTQHRLRIALAGGAPLDLVLDTGANGALLLSDARARALLPAGLAVTTGTVLGPGGPVSDRRVRLSSLDFGGVALADVPVRIEAPGGYAARTGIDGIVGTALLSRLDVVLDFPGQRFLYRRRGESVTAGPTATD